MIIYKSIFYRQNTNPTYLLHALCSSTWRIAFVHVALLEILTSFPNIVCSLRVLRVFLATKRTHQAQSTMCTLPFCTPFKTASMSCSRCTHNKRGTLPHAQSVSCLSVRAPVRASAEVRSAIPSPSTTDNSCPKPKGCRCRKRAMCHRVEARG